MVVIARVVLAISFALSACATVIGPEITSEEEKQARILLRAEAEALPSPRNRDRLQAIRVAASELSRINDFRNAEYFSPTRYLSHKCDLDPASVAFLRINSTLL
jgi:predicted component of type VI protein secretion system